MEKKFWEKRVVEINEICAKLFIKNPPVFYIDSSDKNSIISDSISIGVFYDPENDEIVVTDSKTIPGNRDTPDDVDIYDVEIVPVHSAVFSAVKWAAIKLAEHAYDSYNDDMMAKEWLEENHLA